MKPIPVEDYLQKLIFLEKKLGVKSGKQFLYPPQFNSDDIVEIQRAAKKIAKFLGLGGLTFIISTGKQSQNVAGHIEIQKGQNEVFIEISPEIIRLSPQNSIVPTLEKKNMSDQVSTILSHEITHKFMEIYGISFEGSILANKKVQDNEIFTDITAIFLGLGKLMLNGVSKSKIGYLDHLQLGFVYLIVCNMRKIPKEEYLDGLSKAAKFSISLIEERLDYLFETKFSQYIFNTIQTDLALIERNIRLLDKLYLQTTRDFLETTHKSMNQIQQTEKEFRKRKYKDHCLQYLNLIDLRRNIQEDITSFDHSKEKIDQYKTGISKLITQVLKNEELFPKIDPNMLKEIQCQIDGSDIYLTENRRDIKVDCPICKYKFIANTAVPILRSATKVRRDRKEPYPSNSQLYSNYDQSSNSDRTSKTSLIDRFFKRRKKKEK